MKRWLKRIGLGLLAVIAIVAIGGGIYVKMKTSEYEASIDKVYDVPVPTGFTHTTDPAVVERGKHLAHAMGGCALVDCHGHDLAGGRTVPGGPIGTVTAPNISLILTTYGDGELVRLIRHGLKKDGRTVRMMPSNELNWMPDNDITAIVSWLRMMPPIDKPNGLLEFKTMAIVLDRNNKFPLDIARRIDHGNIEIFGGAPEPTAAYGKYIGRSCGGCHGKNYAGGKIPGTPPSFPVPSNLTPHATGLKDWSFEDFDAFCKTGIRKNGKKVDPFMPQEALSNMDDTEKHALFAFLQSLPPAEFGTR